jgi:glycosyltransferase involved in cell wall biosynthesis
MIVAGIPAHNEEATVGRVVRGAKKFADLVVVCDDGSKDDTSSVASRCGAVVTRHPTNLGYGSAIRSLFSIAKRLGASVLVTLDADAQHDPNSMPSILQPVLNRTADIVIGSRFLRPDTSETIPPVRKIGIVMISKLVQLLSGARISDAQSGYRCYNYRAIQLLNPQRRGMGASTELLFEAIRWKLRLVEVPVRVEYEGVVTSEKNPISHFGEVIFATLESSIRKPSERGILPEN